ncbi:protein DPCD isoform X2 [Brienomyrus brachyistius]|uniref:protein DPCD isoform X2 n=1 Tax=Brienomyrus brachyistius TaxID=42636 RepID=UPI0020B344CA|nr:protein DPCD isoform X2 [Brienomyrus brachyistius]
MAAQSWVDLLRSSRKTVLVHDGKRKVHYLFSDGKQMAEEYDMKTDELVVRKWRTKSKLGAQGPWEMEVGESFPSTEAVLEHQLIKENCSNCLCVKTPKPVFSGESGTFPTPKRSTVFRLIQRSAAASFEQQIKNIIKSSTFQTCTGASCHWRALPSPSLTPTTL